VDIVRFLSEKLRIGLAGQHEAVVEIESDGGAGQRGGYVQVRRSVGAGEPQHLSEEAGGDPLARLRGVCWVAHSQRGWSLFGSGSATAEPQSSQFTFI